MGWKRLAWGWAVLAWAVLLGCGGTAEGVDAQAQAPAAPEVRAQSSSRAHAGAPRWYWFARGIEYEDPLFDVAHDRNGNAIAGGFFGGGLLTDIDGRRIEGTGDFTALVVKFSPQGRLLWYRTFDAVGLGPSGVSYAEVRAVAVDRRGDIVLAGVHSGTSDFGGGPLAGDNFLVKLDAQGHHVWSRAFPEAGVFPQDRMKVAVDRDDDILAIGQRFDAPGVLVKLTPEGEERWRLVDSRGLGTFYSLTVDDDECVYVGGGVDNDGKKPFIFKVSPRGEPRWTRILDTPSGAVQGIAVSGDWVVLSGTFVDTLTFGGETVSEGPGYLAALTRRGHERWVRKTGAGARHYVAAEEGGAVVATGTYRAGEDLGQGPEPGEPNGGNLYALRVDRWDGDVRWVRTFPSEGTIPRAISVADDGTSAIAGVVIFPVDFGDGPVVPGPVQDDPFLLDLAP